MPKVDQNRSKTSRRTPFLSATVAAVLAGGIAFVGYSAFAAKQSHADSSQASPVRPEPGARLVIDREEAELGSMPVSDVRRAVFHLTNTGARPIVISQVRTSCMCTFADIFLPGGKSPEFNMAMHNDAATNAWTGRLPAGQTAAVTITYRPSLMPVEGSITRNVKFATNDPRNPTVELSIHATVRKGAAG